MCTSGSLLCLCESQGWYTSCQVWQKCSNLASHFIGWIFIFHYLNLSNFTYVMCKNIFFYCACIVNIKFSAEFSVPWLCLLLGFPATRLASSTGDCCSPILHCVLLLPGALVPRVPAALTNTISMKNFNPDFLLAPNGTSGLPCYSIMAESRGSLPVCITALFE